MVALVGSFGGFHLTQQGIHFINGQLAVGAHRAMAGHGRQQFVLRALDHRASIMLGKLFEHAAGQVHRITLRQEGPNLTRFDQFPITATTLDDVSPAQQREVLIKSLQSVQFTYPTLLAQVTGAGATAFGTSLTGMTAAARETYLNTTFRRLIGIRLKVSVTADGGGRPGVSELRTTVQVRN